MGKKSSLNDDEKGQIRAYHESGLSNREIGRRLGRSKDVVAQYLSNPNAYGTRKSTGRPQVLNDREKRAIRNAASNSTKGCRRLRNELVPHVGHVTVWNVLKSSPPMLNEDHRLNRARFGDTHQTWTHEWDKVNCLNYGLLNNC